MLWMFLCLSSVYHCQLLECLMKYKQEVWKVWTGSSCLFWDLSKSTSHWLIDRCVFKGSSVRHIVRPIPSQTSGGSDALPLLAQPQASRCHQWVQRPAVHRWDAPSPPQTCWVPFSEAVQNNGVSVLRFTCSSKFRQSHTQERTCIVNYSGVFFLLFSYLNLWCHHFTVIIVSFRECDWLTLIRFWLSFTIWQID